MSKLKAAALTAILAGGLGLAGAALSQDQGGAPPDWSTLVRCAGMGDADARLACYDTAMRNAGYAPKPEIVAQERRKHFGLPMPKLNILKHEGKERGSAEAQQGKAAPAPLPQEDEDRIDVTLEQVAVTVGSKLIFITTEGQVWEQTDSAVVQRQPKPGYVMTIRVGKLKGYFCQTDKWTSVRCERTH